MATAATSHGLSRVPGWRVPFGRFVIAAMLAVLAIACVSGFDAMGFFAVLDRPTVLTVASLLDQLRLPVIIDGVTLMHPAGFGLRIESVCTALAPALVIAASLTMLPLTRERVCGGLIVGFTLLWALNSVRLVCLYYLGVYSPQYFAVAHDWFGQILMVASIFAFLLYWSRPQSGAT